MSRLSSADPATTGAQVIADCLGHRFADPDLLVEALTHRSWCAEQGGESNERLEFLGDAVLGLAVATRLYRVHPGLPEGQLAKIRAGVISADALAEVARRIDLGGALRLGRGEAAPGAVPCDHVRCRNPCAGKGPTVGGDKCSSASCSTG